MISYHNSEANHTPGTIQEFISHYQTEMQNNMIQVADSLFRLRRQPEDRSQLKEIKKLGEAIADLAMVYGYEGVEVIGTRIVQLIDGFDDESNIEELISHLDETIKAVEEVMLLIDERRERQLIRDLSMESEITSTDEQAVTPAPVNENSEEFLFDIREDEKLISLLSDTDGKAVEINQQDKEEDESDSAQIFDANSIFDKKYHQLDFDIPKSSAKIEQTNFNEGLEGDILDIDFKESSVATEKEKNGFLKKISHIFGLKNNNSISA